MKIRLFLYCFLLIVLSRPVFCLAQESCAAIPPGAWEGVVVSVMDGGRLDVFQVETKKILTNMRLAEVEVPDEDRPGGEEAGNYIKKLCLYKYVVVYPKSAEKDDGVTGRFVLPDCGLLHEELLKVGLARCDKTTSGNTHLLSLEQQAQKRNLGIWAGSAASPSSGARKATNLIGGASF
ncbi:MAG: thermonuclease family protein [Deltaproteobacteria bacterium]|nr:thermonuclease family protein [Deltaproteobacteria bacterium]